MSMKGICSALNIPGLQSKVKDPSSRGEDGHLSVFSLSSCSPSCSIMEPEKPWFPQQALSDRRYKERHTERQALSGWMDKRRRKDGESSGKSHLVQQLRVKRG